MHSALARRMVIGVFITLMLLCQTTAAALGYVARALQAPAVTATHAAAPCHPQVQPADREAPAQGGCQDRCPSRDAAFTPGKIDIPAAEAVILSLFVLAAAPPSVATIAAPYARIVANAAPPPRLLVYCRLLI